LFAKILAVFAFCICKVLLKEQLVSIAMPIDCWKTCSSTYATIISSTKSLGKIVKFISPKLTDYYIQMGRSIYQCICRCPSIDEKNGKLVCRVLPMHDKQLGKWVYRCSLIGEINWSMDLSFSAKRREDYVNGYVVVS
jgi:hypothetical protein